MSVTPRDSVLSLAQWSSYLLGTALAGFFFVQLAVGEIDRQQGIDAFEASSGFDLSGTDAPDTSLWAPGRIADYEASLTAELPEVLGVLEISALDLKVPIYADSSELSMDRGAGVVDGMAYPHEPGNIGISGHRDGYFRVLKDIKIGDQLTLQTLEGEMRFQVTDTTIVDKYDTSVLQDTDDTRVTLVTCYPFYFVGHAPKRFIVTATLDTTYVNLK